MLRLANVLLHVLHVAVVGFNLLGWIWPETRPWHLALCGLTLFSWFVLGPLFDELGFCFLTGLQHAVWGKQGRDERPSYMVYLYEQLLGRPAPARLVARVTQGVLYATTALSFVLLRLSP